MSKYSYLVFSLLALLPLTVMAMEVRLAVGLAKPPYIESGGGSGMESALAIATLKEAGHQVQVVQVPQARGFQMLKSGQVDAMITLTPSVGNGLFYSQPLLYYRNRAIVLRDSSITLKSLADLSHYRVAAFQNARLLFDPDYRAAVDHALLYSEQADQDIQNKMLFNKRVDVVIGDELIFRANPTQFNLKGERAPIRTFKLFPTSPRHVGFRNAAIRDSFDKALQLLKQQGRYAEITQFYYKKYQLPAE